VAYFKALIRYVYRQRRGSKQRNRAQNTHGKRLRPFPKCRKFYVGVLTGLREFLGPGIVLALFAYTLWTEEVI
jgi:hypothetical protein